MSYCKTAEVLDTWAEFKQLKRHSSHCLSMLSPCPGPSAILKNSLSAWLVTWSNSNSSNGTLPTGLAVSNAQAVCNDEEFSAWLVTWQKSNSLNRHSSYQLTVLSCSGCLQYWRILANNTKKLGILLCFWNVSISQRVKINYMIWWCVVASRRSVVSKINYMIWWWLEKLQVSTKKLGILASPNSKKLKMGAKKLGILVRFWNFSISHQKKGILASSNLT